MAQNRNLREPPEQDDIGLRAVFQSIDQLASEVEGLRTDIQGLIAEVRIAKPELQDDHQVLSEAIDLTKVEADLFQTQTFASLRRTSEKLNAIAQMLRQLGAVMPAELIKPDTLVEPTRPRQVPMIRHTKRKPRGAKIRRSR